MQESTCVDSLNVKVQGEDFLLLSDKAIYWKKERALLIADLHIGKVTHFRNNNIPIPQKAAQQNFDVMERLFIEHKPIKVLFLGDLFHSYYNKEWELLVFSLAKFPKIKFELITGNHDILQAEHYVAAGITCVREW